MPKSPACISARASLEQIRSLKIAFDTAYALAVFSGSDEDVQKAQALKIELETQMKELEKVIAPIEAERLYDLRSQYESQISFLKKADLLETRIETSTEGKEQEVLFIRDIHGKIRNLPSYETIVERFGQRKELFRTKADQGFTKLLLVPFGSLDELIARFKVYLLAYKKAYDLAHKNDDPPSVFELDKKIPIWKWDGYTQKDIKGDLVYDPVSFTENHGGRTKSEILKQQEDNEDKTAGWRILFVQKGEEGKGIRRIPRSGQGSIQGAASPRPDIEAGTDEHPVTPQMFLEQQVQNTANPYSPYYGESGMTPEEWIVAFITNLEETGQMMDDFQNGEDSASNLTGSYLSSPFNSAIPRMCWVSKAHLVDLTGHVPIDESDSVGVRCVMRG